MKEQQTGRFEALWEKVLAYREESQDPMFSQYLTVFQQRLVEKQHEIDVLGMELEQKHELYLQRLQASENVAELPEVSEQVQSEILQEEKVKKPRRTGEFAIGTYAFSVVGVFFLLISFGMLGAYFMNDFIKGVFLFVVAIVVYAVGEFLLRKKSRPFHLVFGNLGVAAWYIATYANCDRLIGYNYIIALVMIVIFGALFICVDRWRSAADWRFGGVSAGAYYFGLITFLLLGIESFGEYSQAIMISVVLLFSRLLCLWFDTLRPADVGVTILATIFLIAKTAEVPGYIVLVVFIASIFMVRYYHLFYQLLTTLLSVMYVAMSFENDIVITIVVAMMWLFMLLFNYVECYRSRYIQAYNYIVWTCIGFSYVVFAVDVETQMWLMSFIMTFLGVGILSTTISERFGIKEKYRAIACAGFLSYMTLVVPFTYDVTASILLMLIGVVSIGVGFYIKDKVLRIYGLVLSLLVCFKITLFDFAEGESLERMLLFFVAGAVSLVISGIYVLLEKTQKENTGE